MAKLLTRFVSVIIIYDPVETAETSTDDANFPTIRRSTAPYIACRNNANKTGSANRIKGFMIFPTVKLCSFFSTNFSISIPPYPHIQKTRIHEKLAYTRNLHTQEIHLASFSSYRGARQSLCEKKAGQDAGISTCHLIQLLLPLSKLPSDDRCKYTID